ncbi:MAG: class I SAM-dependent methyltransferase [Planctomycetota bacterium]|nr:class I SAM-dependent methyltransferase [Planctomycetota bacterium]
MTCRLCGGHSLGEVIDLGTMPLANNLLTHPDEPAPRRPLKAVFCRDCSLMQLTESTPPDLLFRDYRYFSGQSQTMVAQAHRLVERFVRPGQRVVEIASNDGSLLRHAIARGARVLGIDPAENVAAAALADGVPTRCDYFNPRTARAIRRAFGAADVIFANNVLAHVPDPHELAEGMRILLADDGAAHVEVPYVLRLLDSGAFDTIYHEHYSYYSVSALRRLFNAHDLVITALHEIPIHGGSLHVQIAHRGDQAQADRTCEDERRLGLFDDAPYHAFGARVQTILADLLAALDRFEAVGGFGAAAKAVVLLNRLQLGPDRIPWIADVSPHKQGRYIPGTGQPVVAPDMLMEESPDACLLFPWNIADEICRRNAPYLQRGGRFIVPIPELRLI